MAAFATGVLPNIYEFHLYTGNSTILSGTQACQPPTRPLRPVIPNNASPLRITAAAGTKLAGASSHATVIIESGPCLSPSVADHPLRPATDRRLVSLLKRCTDDPHCADPQQEPNTPRPQRLPTAAACASLLTTRYKLVNDPARCRNRCSAEPLGFERQAPVCRASRLRVGRCRVGGAGVVRVGRRLICGTHPTAQELSSLP
ncbi:hypothetical protein Lal_00013665 [Lupinus albus]|nr:hypothetical protein Lal_00013665 [Lupinus albus]